MFKNASIYYIFIFLIFGYLVTEASPDLTYNELGTRALGMGGSYTAISEGPEALFYNWAVPPVKDHLQFQLNSGRILDTPFYTLSIQNVLNRPYLRLGYLYSASDQIPETYLNDLLQPTLTGVYFKQSIHTLFTSVSKSFFNTHFGLRGSFFFEQLKDENAKSISLDFAAHRAATFRSIPFQAGITLKQLFDNDVNWSTGHTDPRPLVTTIGLSSSFFHESLTVGIDAQHEQHRSRLCLGAEYWFSGAYAQPEGMAIRGGLHHKDFTLGVGFHTVGMSIDYAYLYPHYKMLEAEHRFSLSLIVGAKPKKKVSKPLTFDQPIGRGDMLKTSPLSDSPLSLDMGRSKLTSLLSLDPRPKEPHVTSDPVSTLIHLSTVRIDLTQQIGTFTIQSHSSNIPFFIQDRPVTTKNSVFSLPSTIKLYTPDRSEVFSLDIEQNWSGHILLRGQLPSRYNVMINNNLLTPSASNLIYHKFIVQPKQTSLQFEFMVYEKGM